MLRRLDEEGDPALDGTNDGSNPRGVRRRLAGLLVVLVVAAGLVLVTGVLDPRPRFALRLPGGESFGSIAVELRYATGLVTAIEAGEMSGLREIETGSAVENVPGRPRVLVVRWIGGACDDRTELALTPDPDGYTLSMHTVAQIVLGCTALGVARIVNLELSAEIDATSVSIVRS